MQRFKYKIITLVLCLALVSLVLTGCGGGSIPKPTPKPNVSMHEITGSCELEIKDGIITVSGETDFMKDVILHISVHAQNGTELDSVDIVKSEDKVSHDFVIDTNKYNDSVKSVIGYITCSPKDQSEEKGIFENYGEKFEYIDVADDNYVWNNDGIIILFASEMVAF